MTTTGSEASGAHGANEAEQNSTGTEANAGAKPDGQQLGAGGIKALQAEREAKTAAEKRAAEAEARVKALEDRDKSEAQRAADELAEARRNLEQVTLAKTRAEVAAAKNVPVDLLSGTDQASIEASADALIKYKTEADRAGYIAPNEGRDGGAAKLTSGQVFDAWTQQQNF